MVTKLDKLFALKAVEQKAAEERKLIEYECRDELLAAYAEDGTDRRTSPFFGPEAGKFSVKRYEAKPGKTVAEFALADADGFAAWVGGNPYEVIEYAECNAADFARWHFERTGEVPDGIARVEHETDGEPERLSAQVYSFKPDVVLSKLAEHGNFLEGANRLLLGDGE